MVRARFHYGWVIAAVTFVVLLITAGVRATPALFMVPLEQEFGWNRAVISMAVAINIALFGLIGPFAASVMDKYGLRRVVMAALALLAVSVALTTRMHSEWQLTLLWGIFVGAGTGVTSIVLAGVVATRWFDERRGLVVGALSAANATGQLVFLPLLASIVAKFHVMSALQKKLLQQQRWRQCFAKRKLNSGVVSAKQGRVMKDFCVLMVSLNSSNAARAAPMMGTTIRLIRPNRTP